MKIKFVFATHINKGDVIMDLKDSAFIGTVTEVRTKSIMVKDSRCLRHMLTANAKVLKGAVHENKD